MVDLALVALGHLAGEVAVRINFVRGRLLLIVAAAVPGSPLRGVVNYAKYLDAARVRAADKAIPLAPIPFGGIRRVGQLDAGSHEIQSQPLNSHGLEVIHYLIVFFGVGAQSFKAGI